VRTPPKTLRNTRMHQLAARRSMLRRSVPRRSPRRKQLDEGVYGTLEDLAKARCVAVSYVSRVLRLTLLAPEIVEAILDGRQPADLQLDDLLNAFPLEWEAQCASWQ
jgi:hypothetical protein